MIGLFALWLAGIAVAADDGAPTSTVHIETNKPGFNVAVVDSRGSAVSTTGHTAAAIFTRDVCVAPCSFETEPKMIEVFARGKGKLIRPEQFHLRPGETTLRAQPGSAALWQTGRGAAYVGMAGLVTGLTFVAINLAEDDDPGLGRLGLASSVGGAALLGGGIALMRTNRGKWTITAQPAGPASGPVRL